MHGHLILRDLVVLFFAATLVVIVFRRLKLPHVVGFLITGILIGPYGLDLLVLNDEISALAELGVALLLFTIGLEFSLAELRRIKRHVLVGGSLQVLGTGLIVYLVAIQMGFSVPLSIFLAQVVALSSTAIVLAALEGPGQINSPQGRTILGILLFQDLCVAPMIMITPLLGTGQVAVMPALTSFLGAVLLVGATLLVAVLVVPRILEVLVRVQLREVLTMGVLVITIGLAWFTGTVGPSLALGAFIAGLAVSVSPYSHQVRAEILPFKDAFYSLFFVSIGMLLDVRFVLDHPLAISGAVVGIVVLKGVVAGGAARILSGSNRLAVLVGFSVAQIGEFSFVLSQLAFDLQFLTETLYQGILAVAITTMMLTPFLMAAGERLAELVPASLPGALARYQEERVDRHLEALTGHAVIVGYGLNGRYLAKVLKGCSIPYCILELNPQLVRDAQEAGEVVVFGDASRVEILRSVHTSRARVLVVTVSEPPMTGRVVGAARSAFPELHIITRTKLAEAVPVLYTQGADQVIAEEFETAIEIFARVLAWYDLPRNIIESYVEVMHREGAALMRRPVLPVESLEKLRELLEGSVVENVFVTEKMWSSGHTLAELNLRKATGATVISVVREHAPYANPAGDFRIQSGDLLVLMGGHTAVQKAADYLSRGGPPASGASADSGSGGGAGPDRAPPEPAEARSTGAARDDRSAEPGAPG